MKNSEIVYDEEKVEAAITALRKAKKLTNYYWPDSIVSVKNKIINVHAFSSGNAFAGRLDSLNIARNNLNTNIASTIKAYSDLESILDRFLKGFADVGMYALGTLDGSASIFEFSLDGGLNLLATGGDILFGKDNAFSSKLRYYADKKTFNNFDKYYDFLEQYSNVDRDSLSVKIFKTIGELSTIGASIFLGYSTIGFKGTALIAGLDSLGNLLKKESPDIPLIDSPLEDIEDPPKDPTTPYQPQPWGPSLPATPSKPKPPVEDEPQTTPPPITQEEPSIPTPDEVIQSSGTGGNSYSGESMSFDEPNQNNSIEELEVDPGENLEEESELIVIPASIKTTVKNKQTKKGNALPVLGALGVASAAGLGTKIYLDSKINNTNDEEEKDDIDLEKWSEDETDIMDDDSYLIYDNNKIDELEQGMSEL